MNFLAPSWGSLIKGGGTLESPYFGPSPPSSFHFQQEVHDLEYSAPESATKLFSELANEKKMSKDMRILDAGAGTGLVGEWLQKLGYTNLDALDPSVEMLEQAKLKEIGERKVYKNYHVAWLGEELDIETDTYDGVISVGTFSMGQAKGNGLPELVRIVKPEGLICFTIRNCVLDDPAVETAGKDTRRLSINSQMYRFYISSRTIKSSRDLCSNRSRSWTSSSFVIPANLH